MEFTHLNTLKPWWKIRGALPGDGQVLAGAKAAEVMGLSIGDRLSVNGRNVTVSGLLEPDGSQDDQLLFTILPFAQDVLNKPGLVVHGEVAALCSACPLRKWWPRSAKPCPERRSWPSSPWSKAACTPWRYSGGFRRPPPSSSCWSAAWWCR
jgi:putative ABC transport system permease protein